MKKIYAAIFAFSLLSNAVPLSAAPKPAYVKVRLINPDSSIYEGFTQNTSLEALQRVVLYPRVTGRLQTMNVAKGSVVKRGDQIAILDHDEQDAQIESARADLERTRAESANALIELQRYRRLQKEGFSTQQLLDSKDTAYRSAKAQYDAAHSELTRLSVTRAEYIINASIDGTVLNDYSLVPGAMLSTSTPVAELANLETLKATFSVPEKRFYSVRPGMFVLLRLDALPNDEFRAEIVRVDDYIDPQSRTASVEARIRNESTGHKLRPGMFGRAFIIEKEARDAFVVPVTALRNQRATGDVNELAVCDGDKAKIIAVKTGITQGVNVQILEGLKAGDHVITFGGNALKSGDPIQVMQ